MSNQQMVYGNLGGSGSVPTYTKQYTLLDASAIGRVNYYLAWNSSIVETSNFGAATGDAAALYNFSSGNTPINTNTGLSPARIILARYQPKLTPPGDGIYLDNATAAAIYLRNNSTGSFQTIAITATGSLDGRGAYADNAGELLIPASAGLVSFTTLNWAGGTCVRSTAKYAAIPFSGNQLVLHNSCLIDDRCYVQSNITTGRIGWVHTTTGAYTDVVNYTNVVNAGIVCASSYLGANPFIVTQRGTTNQGNYVDFYNSSGSLIGSINLPLESTTTYTNLYNWVHDPINNYVWCLNSAGTKRLYVLNATTYAIADTYENADLPSGTANTIPIPAVGSPAGGIYALHAPSGTYTDIYKIG